MTFEEYVEQYPNNCKKCYAASTIYEGFYCDTRNHANINFVCVGIYYEDFSSKCPCRKCLVKPNCREKCDEFFEFRSGIELRGGVK